MTVPETMETIDSLGRIAHYVNAYVEIERRSKEAHEYCQKYLLVNAWGKNVWHAILDDAIAMRKELERKNAAALPDK